MRIPLLERGSSMADVTIYRQGVAGRITLNRPQALHALNEEMCLAMDAALKAFNGQDWTAQFAAVKPASSLHAVRADDSGLVSGIAPLSGDGALVNGGYFILRREIFDDIQEGEELVEKPFQRLIARKKLGAWRYDGFWQAMDTFKDKIAFDRMESSGNCPWKVWKQ